MVKWIEQKFSGGVNLSIANAASANRQPLNDTEYDHFFMQLLEGVSQGWGRVQVDRFFAALVDRATEVQWSGWLRHFGTGLQQSETPNRELAVRLLQLGEVGTGEIPQMAKEIGTSLLAKEGLTPQEVDLQSAPPQVSEEVSSDAIETALKAGWELLEAENPQAALDTFDRALEGEENLYRAWVGRGDSLVHLNRLEEGIVAYDRALAIKPDYSKAWSHKGDVLFDLQRIEEALDCWEKALELEPNDAQTWTNKGIALGLKLKRPEEAIVCWQKALELDPSDSETWFQCGLVHGMLQHWEEAIACWDKTTELTPNFRDAWINKGTALQKLGRYTEAIEANNHAIALSDSASSSTSNPGV
ncbi:MAG: tetratricopeptide repeat protein [Geitlerinemataceae cyanobacterium]